MHMHHTRAPLAQRPKKATDKSLTKIVFAVSAYREVILQNESACIVFTTFINN